MSLQSSQPESLSLWWKLSWHATFNFDIYSNASKVISSYQFTVFKHMFWWRTWNCPCYDALEISAFFGGFPSSFQTFLQTVSRQFSVQQTASSTIHLRSSSSLGHQRCLEVEKGVPRVVTPRSVTLGRKPNEIPGGEDDCCECNNGVGERLVQPRGHACGWWERLTGYQRPTDIAHT